MRRGRPLAPALLGLALLVSVAGGAALGPALAQPPPPPPRPQAPTTPAAPGSATAPPPATAGPGVAASPAVVQELSAALAQAIARFEARDLNGVLTYVSDQYWTGPMGKPALRTQLLAIFQIHSQVRARVRIDEVRLVGDRAWVWTTGDVSGQLALVGQWLGLLAWERELEVARRENGAWRLYGYQR